jgi:adenylylsulfate kinase
MTGRVEDAGGSGPLRRNLTAVQHAVGRGERLARFGHTGAVLWLTGLSASGKSTLAMGLEQRLLALGYASYTLDGDNIRHGLNADLGFSPADRAENIRRVGEVAVLFAEAGLICITAFISPYRSDRATARVAANQAEFHEIHVAADLATCESRDPKGLYRKARAGNLRDFTGIDAPYEPPLCAELVIDSAKYGIEECLTKLVSYVVAQLPLAGCTKETGDLAHGASN